MDIRLIQNFFENDLGRVCTENLHRIEVNKSQKNAKVFFMRGKPVFLGLKFECKYMKVGTRHLFSYLCSPVTLLMTTSTLSNLSSDNWSSKVGRGQRILA